MTMPATPEHSQTPLADLRENELAARLRETAPADVNGDLLAEAANRIERFHRFTTLIGLLAPGGTAPRTALEQIYIQSADAADPANPIVLELRGMLANHWGDWTPAINEAEHPS